MIPRLAKPPKFLKFYSSLFTAVSNRPFYGCLHFLVTWRLNDNKVGGDLEQFYTGLFTEKILVLYDKI